MIILRLTFVDMMSLCQFYKKIVINGNWIKKPSKIDQVVELKLGHESLGHAMSCGMNGCRNSKGFLQE